MTLDSQKIKFKKFQGVFGNLQPKLSKSFFYT